MSVGWLLLNAAYVIYTVSAALKDIFYLRVALLAATFLYIAYGLYEPVWSIFLWNIPVAVLHIWALWQLFKDRRGINLDAEAEAIHTLMFPGLSRVSFNAMWHAGEERVVSDQVLIEKNKPVSELMLILSGEVEVEVADELNVRVDKHRLGRYRLLGEISMLRGTNATATVSALDDARIRVWQKTKLDELGKKFPDLEVGLLQAMGADAATKLN